MLTEYSCLPPHDAYAFCNVSLAEPTRLDDLIGKLTTTELIGQLFMDADLAFGNTTYPNSSKGDLKSTSVPRLGIAQFSHLGQGSVYRGASNGCNLNCCTGGKPPCIFDRPYATVFPQGTGFAASFDTKLVFEAAVAIADESRSFQRYVSNRTVEYRSGASSVINIARDPRWGRVPETYGECPTLTGKLAVAFNKGLMGFASATSREPPSVLKLLPVMRHFAAYAGPERTRFSFNARVNEKDLELTYLPAWRRLVREGALVGVMSAISALNGVPGIAHRTLLTHVLRDTWLYEGFVLSDCDTFPSLLPDTFPSWDWAGSAEQAAADALGAGNDINCGPGFGALLNATRLGFVNRSVIALAARRVLRMRMRVGDLQPPQTDPWWEHAPPLSVVGSPEHAAIVDALVAGGTTLLHHTPGTLPIGPPIGPPIGAPILGNKARTRARGADTGSVAAAEPTASYTIALIGPSADDVSIQAHTYHGTPFEWISLRKAMEAELGGRATLTFAPGCAIDSPETSGFAAAIALAQTADAVVYAGGLNNALEEEDTDRMSSLGLPGVQLSLVEALRNATAARRVPLVTLLVSGGPLAVPSLVPPSPTAVDALLWTSYYGQSARPLARILLGTALPTGRLPFTVPYNTSSLPPIEDYDMNAPPGRTYRYLDAGQAPPLFPFGFGLTLGQPWALEPLQPSSLRLTLSALRAAAAEPCTETSGTGLLISTRLSRPRLSGLANGLAAHSTDLSGPVGHSLLLFGALHNRTGARSPYPRQQLLDVVKPLLLPGDSTLVTLRVCASELLEEGLGLDRQPLPNTLRLWVGDAARTSLDRQVDVHIDLDEFEDACD